MVTGGGIMVWGCMMTQGVGHLALVSGTLHSSGYIDLLENSMIPCTHGLCVSNDFIFQQDNARCHTSRESMAWFEENETDVMTWPAQCPDLNPIENLWDELGRRIDGYTPRNKEELGENVKNQMVQDHYRCDKETCWIHAQKAASCYCCRGCSHK